MDLSSSLTDSVLVSCMIATRNRRPFIPTLLKCLEAQTYLHKNMEILICDDGTDPVEEIVSSFSASTFARVHYWHLTTPVPLGHKRNLMNQESRGDIIVYFDDDDFYPPTRVQHAVTTLSSSSALVAGCSAMYMYFPSKKRIMICGPYGDNHCTAATMAFKRTLLLHTSYDNHSLITEEKSFLKNFTFPMVQLDPFQTVLTMSHDHSSCNKDIMLANPRQFQLRMAPSKVTFESFQMSTEMQQFYIEELTSRLASFPDGSRTVCKPEIEKEVSSRQHLMN